MAFESQMAAQREQSKQRLVIKQKVFMLHMGQRKQGKKQEENVLNVRLPLEYLKAAKIDVKQPIDIFYDHENHKAMIANSLGGVKWQVKGDVAMNIFVFRKGFTPDFKLTVVQEHTTAKFGDGQGVVFDYKPLMMVSGLNELKPDEQPTRPQTFALGILAEERKRTEAAITELTERAKGKTREIAAAPPSSTQPFSLQHEPVADGHTRRTFSDTQKKEGVRAHLRWMQQGYTFSAACTEVGVAESVLRKWRAIWLKEVEKEEKRLAQSNGGKKALNGAHAHH